MIDVEDLTTREIGRLDRINIYTRAMGFGTKFQEMIDALNVATDATPVNAVNASKSLAVSGVVIDGETVTIDNPLIAGTDVYEFLADAAQTKTTVTNKAVDIESYTTKSHGHLTVDTQPISADTMTIGTKVYTFVPVGTANADGEISVGADKAAAQANIVAAINGTDEINDAHPLVSAAAFDTDVSVITALVGGVAGDAIATTETFDAGTNIFVSATLTSGADCTAANAIIALAAAMTALDTQGVGGADGTGDTIDLTADVAGVSGNDITLAETMANGAFAGAATELSGGVDGTVGKEFEMAADSSYLYVAIAANAITDKNWRRISLGSAY